MLSSLFLFLFLLFCVKQKKFLVLRFVLLFIQELVVFLCRQQFRQPGYFALQYLLYWFVLMFSYLSLIFLRFAFGEFFIFSLLAL